MAKVIMTPVFATPEQEAEFAKCASEAMSIDARLTWSDEEDKHYKNVLTPVFKTPEEEELFSKIANEVMLSKSHD